MMPSSEGEVMPRPKDESKYQQPDTVETQKARRLHSAIKADRKRDNQVDDIRLRVPKGMRDQIRDYVVTLPEYQIRHVDRETGVEKRPPDPNVNQWLVDLIRSQLPHQD